MTFLPETTNGESVQALSFKSGGAQTISVGASSARNSVALGSDVVLIHSDVDVYFECGDGAVTATSSSHHLPAGVVFPVSLLLGSSKRTHIAVLQVSGAGTFYISETD